MIISPIKLFSLSYFIFLYLSIAIKKVNPEFPLGFYGYRKRDVLDIILPSSKVVSVFSTVSVGQIQRNAAQIITKKNHLASSLDFNRIINSIIFYSHARFDTIIPLFALYVNLYSLIPIFLLKNSQIITFIYFFQYQDYNTCFYSIS